jgi:hypothetical protein
LLHLWPNKARGFDICHHARSRLMLPLKVPGVSHCFITYLLGKLYTIFKFFFIHVYIIHKYQFIAKSQTVVFGNSHLLPTLQIDANECRLMCDFQRLSRTAFLHFSVPLSSKRQLNCWATWFVLQISCCILAWDLCEFHTEQ